MLYSAILVATLVLCFVGVQSTPSYQCTTLTLPVNVTLNATQLNVQEPNGELQLTGFVQETFSMTSNVSELIGREILLSSTYNIWSKLCFPENFTEGGIVEFAVHGVTVDHFYWEFGGAGSVYNYVEAAISAGHAIFIFDRLGTGMSSTPDGIKEVQTSTHIAIAAELVAVLRKGIDNHSFGRIVAIGHSYGSYVLAGMAAAHGTIVDDLVLTGFTTFTGASQTFLAGFGLGIASELNSTKFGSLSNSYMTMASPINVQQTFYFFPEFSQSALDFSVEHKGVFTIGELITIPEAIEVTASAYTGSVLIVTGDKDFIVCGGNCFQELNGSTNLVDSSQSFFPSAKKFSSNIPARTGHLLNAHFNAHDTYKVILDWIGE